MVERGVIGRPFWADWPFSVNFEIFEAAGVFKHFPSVPFSEDCYKHLYSHLFSYFETVSDGVDAWTENVNC